MSGAVAPCVYLKKMLNHLSGGVGTVRGPFLPLGKHGGLDQVQEHPGLIQEADRALAAGAMEHVPASRLAEVFELSTIHPWSIVDQAGEGSGVCTTIIRLAQIGWCRQQATH